MRAQIAVGVNEIGDICSVHKQGMGSLPPQDMVNAIQLARSAAVDRFQRLKSQVQSSTSMQF